MLSSKASSSWHSITGKQAHEGFSDNSYPDDPGDCACSRAGKGGRGVQKSRSKSRHFCGRQPPLLDSPSFIRTLLIPKSRPSWWKFQRARRPVGTSIPTHATPTSYPERSSSKFKVGQSTNSRLAKPLPKVLTPSTMAGIPGRSQSDWSCLLQVKRGSHSPCASRTEIFPSPVAFRLRQPSEWLRSRAPQRLGKG